MLTNDYVLCATVPPHPSPLPQGRGRRLCRHYFVGISQPWGRAFSLLISSPSSFADPDH